MPHQIRIKRSETPGGVPERLGYGELAFNFADRVLYIGDRNGNAIVVAGTEPVEWLEPPAAVPDTPTTAAQSGYTTNGVRRRLLPFE
jgi:hypothetical protein